MAAGGTPSAGSTPAPGAATGAPSSAPQGGKGGNPSASGSAPAPTAPAMPSASPMAGFAGGYPAVTYPAVTPSASPVAPTAPQQPQFNPFMQTYGQNNTPQQQTFNRFQPQQYGNFGPQGGYGRGFMPQNRGGYERQMDQLRGGYNRPMPPMMQNNPQPDAAYNTYMQSLPEYAQQQDLQKQMAALSAKMQADPQGTTMRNALQANAGQIMPRYDPRPPSPEEYARQRGYQYEPPARGNQTLDQFQLTQGGGQQQGAQQAAFMNSLLNGQPLSGQPATGQTPIPAYAQPYATSLANQPNTPAGGKGGNPTATGSGVSPVAPPIGSGFY